MEPIFNISLDDILAFIEKALSTIKELFAKMKRSAILINTSRGAVVDEAAVSAALDSGKLYGMGTDVFATEPCGKDNLLARHPRCIATPHVAWSPSETRDRVIAMAGENLAAFLAGKPIRKVN
jgi:glycerate dehydrogenase